MKSNPSALKLIGLMSVLILVVLSGYIIIASYGPRQFDGTIHDNNNINGRLPEIARFEDEKDFSEYLAKSRNISAGGRFGFAVAQRAELMMESGVADMSAGLDGGSGGYSGVNRFSETNVQVQGIDEPDIVKTNGEDIFVSTPSYYDEPVFFEGGIMPRMNPTMLMEDVEEVLMARENIRVMPQKRRGGVASVKAFPPEDLSVGSVLDMSGDLMLHDDVLIIFSYDKIVGYDISNIRFPEKIWENSLEKRSGIVTSRLYDDKLYVITSTNIDFSNPCPIRPMIVGDDDFVVPCSQIYHPVDIVPTDSTYTVMVIDPSTGEVKDSVSLTGSQGQSVVYMSANSIYVAQQKPMDVLPFIVGFFSQNSDLIPKNINDKLSNLMEYDIGINAKMAELSDIMSGFQMSLDGDERLKIENEMNNRMEVYYEKNKRSLSSTLIAKVDISESGENLGVSKYGSVPGRLLNQFSLDEYDENLRVATTIDRQWLGFGGFGIGRGGESVNDLYVLDKDLKTIGSLIDLGRDERIFAMRFMGDVGYMVTFRQIDPFFVIDLSDEKNPRVAGELKIPGFSSYLHPLRDKIILGVGREDSRVKLSLFDVSNPNNPIEKSKYLLSEYWSEVQNTSRAFLQDSDNEIFFIPGGRAGYIFSYSQDKITLKKAISDIQARRAVFINNYMYIIGNDKIVVINLDNFERVSELSLN